MYQANMGQTRTFQEGVGWEGLILHSEMIDAYLEYQSQLFLGKCMGIVILFLELWSSVNVLPAWVVFCTDLSKAQLCLTVYNILNNLPAYNGNLN